MEKIGKKKPVSSNRSPATWDSASRDMLVRDPTSSMMSVRRLLLEFAQLVVSIEPGDVLSRYEDTYRS